MNEQMIFQMLLQRAMNDPSIMNNPQSREIVDVLRSGDAQRGQTLAQNYAQSYGVSPQKIVQDAQQRVRQMFRSG